MKVYRELDKTSRLLELGSRCEGSASRSSHFIPRKASSVPIRCVARTTVVGVITQRKFSVNWLRIEFQLSISKPVWLSYLSPWTDVNQEVMRTFQNRFHISSSAGVIRVYNTCSIDLPFSTRQPQFSFRRVSVLSLVHYPIYIYI
jgi:hypothetical protein